jgi:signal transduction histidine kinase
VVTQQLNRSSVRYATVFERSRSAPAGLDSGGIDDAVVRSELGWEPDGIRLAVPDEDGRLRTRLVTGSIPRKGSSQRTRHALDRRLAARQTWVTGRELFTVPLVANGDGLGVLEIVTPTRHADERWATVLTVADRLSARMAFERERAALASEVETMRTGARVCAAVSQAHSTEGALHEATNGLYYGLGLTSVAWLLRDDGPPRIVCAAGVSIEDRERLAEASTRSPMLEERGSFAELLGAVGEVNVVEVSAGDAILAVGPVPTSGAIREVVDAIGVGLRGTLDLVAALEWAKMRDGQLDTALALTAHELRGPILASKATIDAMLTERGWSAVHRARLRDSRRQLEAVAEIVDPLLRWAATGSGLRRRRCDLVDIVTEAIDAAEAEMDQDRVVLDAPTRVRASVSRTHLRIAVVNLVRNALAYSQRDTTVHVEVTEDEHEAFIIVKDTGVRIAASEARSIFEPFVRGEAGVRTRAGRGLGLFVVRRIAEAHGGRAEVRSDGDGVEFFIGLPVGSVRHGEVRGVPSTP